MMALQKVNRGPLRFFLNYKLMFKNECVNKLPGTRIIDRSGMINDGVHSGSGRFFLQSGESVYDHN